MNYVIIYSSYQTMRSISTIPLTHSIFRVRCGGTASNSHLSLCNAEIKRLCSSFKHKNYPNCVPSPQRFLYTIKNHTVFSKSLYNERKFGNNCVLHGVMWHVNIRNISDQGIANKGVFYEAFYDSPPVLFTQECLLKAHDISGLPWWATIVLSTILLRTTITLPLSLYQCYILAKVENIKLELKEMSKEVGRETGKAVQHFNWTEKQAKAVYIRTMKKQWKRLIERDNCHPAKATLLVLVQIPLWVSLSLGLRNLIYLLPVPDVAAKVTLLELCGGGILWFPNLVVPDTTFILPIVLGLTNLAIIELQSLSRVQETSKLQNYLKNFFRAVSVAMVPIAASVPSCLCLYWVTSSAVGLVHNVLQLSPRVRSFCRIPESASVPKHPFKHIIEKLSHRLHFLSPPRPPRAT